MTGASILLLGVGRSGTTAMFSLLQTLLEQKFTADPTYFYEPFLWDSSKLPRLASDFDDQFSYMQALSPVGIGHHLKLPLLATMHDPSYADSEAFLNKITQCTADKPALLTKMIRATGRSALLRQASPQAKILFLIRNPVDVVNSITNMFSLYGDDFHESDFARFRKEVATLYPADAQLFPHNTQVEREGYYWFFSNLHFLRTSGQDPLVKAVIYEQLVDDRKQTLKDTCGFLDLDLNQEIIDESARPVGWVSDVNLTASEIDQLKPYEEAYRNILLPEMEVENTVIQANLNRQRAPLAQISNIREQREELRGRGPLFLVDEVIRANFKKSEYVALQTRLATTREKLAFANQRERDLGERLAETTTQLDHAKAEIDELASIQEKLELAYQRERDLGERLAETVTQLDHAKTEIDDMRASVFELEAQQQIAEAFFTSLSRAFEKLLPISFWRNPLSKFRAYRDLVITYVKRDEHAKSESVGAKSAFPEKQSPDIEEKL